MADNKDKKVLNVPALRFPEFIKSWECSILEKLSKKIGDGIHSTPSYDDNGTFYFINGNNLNGGKIVITSSTKRVSEKEAYKNNAENLEANSILMSINGTIGNVALYHNEPIMLGKSACYINSKDNIDKNYLFYYLQYPKTQLYFEAELTGTTIKNLSLQSIRKTKIYIPTIEEQHKISRFLQKIDERISTQNKIIEDLKKLKSAISKYLFARKDLLETTICLSNIATLKNGYAFQSGKYNALGKWKILTITNVPGERYINDEDCNCIINLPNDIQDHQVLKEGDILISLTGNVGRVSLCKNGNYLLNQRVGLLQLAKNVNQEFLYQILSSQRFENSMIACGQGAAQMNIGKGDVENYVLPYSSNGNNILFAAKILHSYDECIINELRRLTLLTMQKQYLLTQMFI